MKMENYDSQLSITVNGFMVNIREAGENADARVAKRAEEWFDRLKVFQQKMKEPSNSEKLHEAVNQAKESVKEVGGCTHNTAIAKSGVSRKTGKEWTGEVCEKCGAIRFLNYTKANGSQWGEWQPPKAK
jgi:hypothetical protein